MPGWGNNDNEFGSGDKPVLDFGNSDKEWGGSDKEISTGSQNPGIMAIPNQGKISLIPTRDETGRDLSDSESQQQFKMSGNQIGAYDTPAQATTAANDWVSRSRNAPMASSHVPGGMKSLAAPQGFTTSTTDDYGNTYEVPLSQNPGSLAEVKSQLSHAWQTTRNIVSGGMNALSKSLPIGEGADTGTERGYKKNVLKRASDFLAEDIAEKKAAIPVPESAVGDFTKTVSELAPHLVAGPLAPFTMAADSFENTYRQLVASGIPEDQARDAATASGLVAGVVGGATGGITKGMLPKLAPGLSRWDKVYNTLTKEVEAGGRGPVSKFIIDLFAGGAKTGTEFAAMGMANEAISEAAGMEPDKANSWLQKRLSEIKTGFVFHAVPTIAKEVVRAAKAAVPEKVSSTPPAEPTEAPVAGPRTRQVVESELIDAIRNGDSDKANKLTAEIDSLVPKQAPVAPTAGAPRPAKLAPGLEPAFKETDQPTTDLSGRRKPELGPEAKIALDEAMKPGGGVKVTEPEGLSDAQIHAKTVLDQVARQRQEVENAQAEAVTRPNKEQRRQELEPSQTEPPRTPEEIKGLEDNLASLTEQRDQAIESATRLTRTKDVRRTNRLADRLSTEVEQKTAELEQAKKELAGSWTQEPVKPEPAKPVDPSPEPPKPTPTELTRTELPIVDSTSYKGERKGALMGPNDEMMVARDPETGKDIGRLWITKKDGGFEVRKVETEPEFQGRGVATKLYKQAAERFGPYKGSSDQTEAGRGLVDALRAKAPEVFEQKSGLTPGGSGTSLLSNEEVKRSERGDTYYRVDRSGRITNLGPQPDAPVRKGEAIIMVDGRTGKPQVQNSDGLGNDQAVLSRFGRKVLETHGESQMRHVAAGLDLTPALDAVAARVKQRLGLPEGSSNADLAKWIGRNIGELGKTARETAIKILNKFKDIGRDLADAIAKHLHEAVSGSRESQKGAIGPDISKSPEQVKAEAKAVREQWESSIKRISDPEVRKELYKLGPPKAKAEVAPAPPAPPESYDRVKGFIAGITQPARDVMKITRIMASGDNSADNAAHKLLTEMRVLPKEYVEGSGKTVEVAQPFILNNPIKRIKDLSFVPKTDKGTIQELFQSPHNVEEKVTGRSQTPTQDIQMGTVAMMHNANNLSKFFRDTLDTHKIADSSPEMHEVAKPLFDRFTRARGLMEPLEAQKKAIDKAVKDASPTEISRAREVQSKWNAENGEKLGKAVEEMRAVEEAHQAMLKTFAKEYPDARVALAAEFPKDKVPDWIKLEPNEVKAADAFRDQMSALGEELKKQGINVIEGNYMTHMTKFLAEDTGMDMSQNRSPREVLNFPHREADSTQWLPSANAIAADYTPNVSRKLAMQPFYNKWRPMIDPANMEGFANPASPNYAPNFSKYLTNLFNAMDKPDSLGFFEKAVQAARDYQSIKLLSGNIRVGWKHLAGKLTQLVGQQDVWVVPGIQKQLKGAIGRLSAEGPIRAAIDKLGLKTSDWQKKAELIDYFSNSKELLGMLRENPITSGVAEMQKYGVADARFHRAIRNALGNKAPEYLAKVRQGIKNVTSQPVSAVEAWENALDLMASLEKGHSKGMSAETNIKEAIGNILDFNFRGGADAPGIVKGAKTRLFVQFAQTPVKMAELKAKLIMQGLKGGKDVYGTDYTANLVKHIVATIVAFSVAKQMGVNVFDSIAHLPFFNATQLGRIGRMAFYGGKMALGAAGDEDENKYTDAKMGFMGDDRGLFVGSPAWDTGKTVKTLMTEGPKAEVQQTPAFQQIKAILTGEPPEGFDSVLSYLTNERNEDSKDAMEQRAIKQGIRATKAEGRRARRNEWAD